MKKELAALLSRSQVDQTETSQNAIHRLLKLVSSEQADPGARQALFDLLSSPRLAVVSSACQGMVGALCSTVQNGASLLNVGPTGDVHVMVDTPRI